MGENGIPLNLLDIEGFDLSHLDPEQLIYLGEENKIETETLYISEEFLR